MEMKIQILPHQYTVLQSRRSWLKFISLHYFLCDPVLHIQMLRFNDLFLVIECIFCTNS